MLCVAFLFGRWNRMARSEIASVRKTLTREVDQCRVQSCRFGLSLRRCFSRWASCFTLKALQMLQRSVRS